MARRCKHPHYSGNGWKCQISCTDRGHEADRLPAIIMSKWHHSLRMSVSTEDCCTVNCTNQNVSIIILKTLHTHANVDLWDEFMLRHCFLELTGFLVQAADSGSFVLFAIEWILSNDKETKSHGTRAHDDQCLNCGFTQITKKFKWKSLFLGIGEGDSRVCRLSRVHQVNNHLVPGCSTRCRIYHIWPGRWGYLDHSGGGGGGTWESTHIPL